MPELGVLFPPSGYCRKVWSFKAEDYIQTVGPVDIDGDSASIWILTGHFINGGTTANNICFQANGTAQTWYYTEHYGEHDFSANTNSNNVNGGTNTVGAKLSGPYAGGHTFFVAFMRLATPEYKYVQSHESFYDPTPHVRILHNTAVWLDTTTSVTSFSIYCPGGTYIAPNSWFVLYALE